MEKGDGPPMNALTDRQDNFRAPLDPYGAVTHEVFNQPVELVDFNLYDSDAALKDAVCLVGFGDDEPKHGEYFRLRSLQASFCSSGSAGSTWAFIS